MSESTAETRPLRPFVALGFAGTHEALAAERALLEAGLAAVPIPTPRALGAACGISMRLPPEQVPRADEVLRGAGIEVRARVDVQDI